MPEGIKVRVAAGRLLIKRDPDDAKKAGEEYRRMDRTDKEAKAAWKRALEGGAQPPDDGLYVVNTSEGVSTLCGVTDHAAHGEVTVRAKDGPVAESDAPDQVDVGEQAAELDEADASAEQAAKDSEEAAREAGAEPEPADDPRELAGDKGEAAGS